MAEKPAWMSDPEVAFIPQEKLDFLSQMFENGKGKSQKELMTAMLPLLKKAKQENLTFTAEEMNAAITAIRKHSSSEENEKIDHILKKAQERKD